jgi:hypothetical protein
LGNTRDVAVGKALLADELNEVAVVVQERHNIRFYSFYCDNERSRFYAACSRERPPRASGLRSSSLLISSTASSAAKS